jgi:membrane protein YdbS with pleckstrin-like domain
VGNLGGYFGPNVPIWAKLVSKDPSAALYIIAAVLLVGSVITFFFIPKELRVRIGAPSPDAVGTRRT